MIVNCPKCGIKFENQKNKWVIKFCSRKCSNSRIWTEADKKKKSESAKKFYTENPVLNRKGKIYKVKVSKDWFCVECGSFIRHSIREKKICENKKCDKIHRAKIAQSSYLIQITKQKFLNNSIVEKQRLRDIGRKGGFGKKGITLKGTRYDSLLEKSCFEYLEKNEILFEAHKYLPESAKVSDVYLPKLQLWIEIDGINREKKKKWIGKDYDYWKAKLKEYEDKKLEYKVVYSLENFIEIINELLGVKND